MLTKRQRDVLVFVDQHIRERGYSPSFQNIAESIGNNSKGHVAAILDALEERGFIRRIHSRARAIEVLRPIHQPPSITNEIPVIDRKPDVTLPRDIGAAPPSVRSAALVGVRLK